MTTKNPLLIASALLGMAGMAMLATDVPPVERDKEGALVPRMSYAEFLDRSYRLVTRDLDGWATGNAYKDPDGKPVPGYINYALVNPARQLGVGHPLNADTVYPAFHHALFIRAFLSQWRRAGDPNCLARARQLADWSLTRRTPSDCRFGSLFYSTVSKGKVGGNVDGDAIMTDKPAIKTMGIHTLHWAALLADLHAATGEAAFKQRAINACALVTYWMRGDNANLVSPDWGDEIWFGCHFGPALYLHDTLSRFPELLLKPQLQHNHETNEHNESDH